MEIEKVEETEDVLKLKLSDSDEAVANALRRSMMSKVPTLAVKHLEISRNDSGLFDEVVANRVGQIPFSIPENVDEESEVHVALNQDGPGKAVASDIQTDNDEAEPVNPDTEIVNLKEDQGLEFEGVAVLNTGSEHAKHQGGTVGYEKTDEGEYEFRIESTSGYSNEELFNKAVEIVQSEIEEFEKLVDDI